MQTSHCCRNRERASERARAREDVRGKRGGVTEKGGGGGGAKREELATHTYVPPIVINSPFGMMYVGTLSSVVSACMSVMT